MLEGLTALMGAFNQSLFPISRALGDDSFTGVQRFDSVTVTTAKVGASCGAPRRLGVPDQL